MTNALARFLLEVWLPVDLRDMLEDLELHFGSTDLAIAEALRNTHAQLFSTGTKNVDEISSLLATARMQSLASRGGHITPFVATQPQQASHPPVSMHHAAAEPLIRRRRSQEGAAVMPDLATAIGKKTGDDNDKTPEGKPDRPALEDTMDAMIWGDE